MASSETQVLLGVSKSLTGRSWAVRSFNPQLALAISQKYDLAEIMGRILSSRGVPLDGVESYLNPRLKDMMPDPFSLKDLEVAANRIAGAIMSGEKVGVFGDYDVDGATSSSLLLKFFKMVGGNLKAYIPDRLKEGYGPNIKAIKSLKSEGINLIMTVDCGTLSFGPLKEAKDAGIEMIVVDHHKAEPALPEALAVINPNRLDENGSLGQLAAVGVSFLLVVGINRVLREEGHYKGQITPPDLMSLLDLVALGTICDVVPLQGLNRAFAIQGFKVMAKRQNTGLRVLSDVARIEEAPNSYHAGFIIGPRINAGGRVGEAQMGTTLLASDDEEEALSLSQDLDQYNSERKDIEAFVQKEALLKVETEIGLEGEVGPIVFVSGKGWHPGVIGIVASRLKEKYSRPTMVLAENNGIGKGSGRSISGVDLGAAVIEAAHHGLLQNGGGHAMAAGLTVEASKIEDLKTFLTDWLRPMVSDAIRAQSFSIDGVLTIKGITPELIDTIAKAGPFGSGNPTPRFAISDVKLVKADIVGKDHVRAFFSGGDGGRLKAMAFRAGDEKWGQNIINNVGKTFHIAGRIKKDDWLGKANVEMHLEDASFT